MTQGELAVAIVDKYGVPPILTIPLWTGLAAAWTDTGYESARRYIDAVSAAGRMEELVKDVVRSERTSLLIRIVDSAGRINLLEQMVGEAADE
jgi:hypothetical protein